MRPVKQMDFKHLYDELKDRVATLADDLRHDKVDKNIDAEPWFRLDRPMYISNHMEVVDNEEYALEHWGKGKYHRYVLDKDTK